MTSKTTIPNEIPLTERTIRIEDTGELFFSQPKNDNALLNAIDDRSDSSIIKSDADIYIGSKMPNKAEYNEARKILGKNEKGKIELPKANCDYVGEIIQCSDTHIVQRVSPFLAIAHSVTKVDNVEEIQSAIDKGYGFKETLNFSYNSTNAFVTQVLFDQNKADLVEQKLKNFSKTLPENSKVKESFEKLVLNHIREAKQSLAPLRIIQSVERPIKAMLQESKAILPTAPIKPTMRR